MKHEWKKHEKELYTPKATPRLISVPTQQFIMICGKGSMGKRRWRGTCQGKSEIHNHD